jgi:hypothetical protein
MRVFIAGVTRNSAKTLEDEIENLMKCFEFTDYEFFVVESDSNDETLEILKSISDRYSKFNFISHGKLELIVPNRISRITHCRNSYMKMFYRDQERYDYLVVVDLDGINRRLKTHAVQVGFQVENEGMISANQLGPYYDLWALRSQNWMEDDCHRRFKDVIDAGKSVRVAFFKIFIIPMFHSRNETLIKVESAFGGLAIYNSIYLKNFYYSELNVDGIIQCEHVHFNRKVSEYGGKLAIHTDFINAGLTKNAVRTFLRFIGIFFLGRRYFKIFKKIYL